MLVECSEAAFSTSYIPQHQPPILTVQQKEKCFHVINQTAYKQYEGRSKSSQTDTDGQYNQAYSEYKYLLTFRVRRYVVIATKLCTDCKSANYAQVDGIPYQSLKLHPGSCSSVGMQQGTNRHTHDQYRYTFHVIYNSRET